ncbi:MAG: DUF1461 domain-containing protein [Coriobacteriales bacterium]|nr:DUF1461 domain-containing protein [Coriobacteriales bacterium]
MRRVETALVAVALALTAAGLALIPLTSQWFTAQLSARFSQPAVVGIDQAKAAGLAEAARSHVSDFVPAELPRSVDGRSGFDETSVSHLTDVRRVISGARLAAGLLAGALTLWMALCTARGDYGRIARGLRAGAWACFGLVAAAAVFATVSFDAFFAWFHSLFFAPGTWVFPSDSLLIALFPQGFWIAAGIAWGALVLLTGGALVLASRAVSRTGERRINSASAQTKA